MPLRASKSLGETTTGLSRGSSQAGVRLYNERLVLSLIRRHKSLSKVDIARVTGLSQQTISIITNRLTEDGLLLRGTPKRGSVGQPSVPYSLNPEGAYFVGLKIGRRSSDVILLDFCGRVIEQIHEPHPFPTPEGALDLVRRGATELIQSLGGAAQQRIYGFGIASPFELWNWEPQLGAPRSVVEAWKNADIHRAAARISPWPVYVHNDGTAACAAEFVLGGNAGDSDFLYVFVGSFVGGGVVLGGHLYPGRSLYAGAVGPLPVPDAASASGFKQVLRSASIYVLAEYLREAGSDPAVLWQKPNDWGDLGPPLERWIEESAQSLAIAVVSAVSIIDFSAIVIDGAFPLSVRSALVERIRSQIKVFDLQGLAPFTIKEGTIGHRAREIGGAVLPLLANFTQDREVLFKDAL